MQIYTMLSADETEDTALDLAKEVGIENLPVGAFVGNTSGQAEWMIDTGEDWDGKDVLEVYETLGDLVIYEVIEDIMIDDVNYQLWRWESTLTGDVWYSWVRYEGYGTRVGESEYAV